jgi:hypothetical protein
VGSLLIVRCHFMSTRERWSKILIIAGYIAMLAGALDPLEGSLVILPGSALVALGSFLSQGERPWIARRLWCFGLIACGVAALFGLSAAGGIGGKSGHSLWWGLLVLPYLLGWLMGILGSGSPRWVQSAGIMVGLWYLAIPLMVLMGRHPSPRAFPMILVGLGALGLVVIGGCIWRLRHRTGLGTSQGR